MPDVRRWTGLDPARWQAMGVDWIVWHSYPIPWSSEPLPAQAKTFESVLLVTPFDGPVGHPVLEPLDAYYLPLSRFGGITRPGPRVEVFRRRQAAGGPGRRPG